jgi:hypothetical protein
MTHHSSMGDLQSRKLSKTTHYSKRNKNIGVLPVFGSGYHTLLINFHYHEKNSIAHGSSWFAAVRIRTDAAGS